MPQKPPEDSPGAPSSDHNSTGEAAPPSQSDDAPENGGASSLDAPNEQAPLRLEVVASAADDDGTEDGAGSEPPAETRPAALPEEPRQTPAQKRRFEELVGRAARQAERALSASTRRVYRIGWEDFLAFCRQVNRRPLPASVATVAAYVQARSEARPTPQGARTERKTKGLAASTLEQRLSAIRHHHERRGFASPTEAPGVRDLMRAIRADDARQAELPRLEAAPLTSRRIRRMMGVLPGAVPAPPKEEAGRRAAWLRGLRDRAMILVGFATAMRPDELLAVEVRHVERVEKGLVVHIPRSKTDQEASGQFTTALYNEANPEYCPVEALGRWLAAAGIRRGACFRGVRNDGRLLPGAMSYDNFNKRIQAICKKAQITPENYNERKRRRFSAHSLRAGHVTDARANGADDRTVMRQTRHTSPATLEKYDRPETTLEDSSSGYLGLYYESATDESGTRDAK